MDYLAQFQDRFIGIMQWEDCHALFEKLSNNPNDWYLYNTSKIVILGNALSALSC
jgi:hypothetical protein